MSNTPTQPFAVALKQGKKYFWCRCGHSAKQPFCDGSHQGSDVLPLVFEADKTGDVYLCGCKQTGNAPYCDGSHKQLKND